MRNHPKPLHVVLGAGPAGSAIAAELARDGLAVRHVDRKPVANAPAGVETVQADLSSADGAVAATDGADVIYHAVNVAYHLQVDVLPGIADSLLAAAHVHDAKLVVLDTLYPYGEADGEAITEQTPWAARTRKGLLRAELDRRYLEEHGTGRVRVALGRSADFFGPGVENSTLGGASLWVMGGKKADEYKGVAKFFTFLSDTDRQVAVHKASGYLPITKAAYQKTKDSG